MHRMKKSIFSAMLFLVAVFATATLPAAESPATDPASSPPPAMELMFRMANFLAQLKQFSVTIQAGYDVLQESGQKIEFGETRKLTVVRPDRLRVDVEQSDGDESSTVFDGKTITVWTPKVNMYATSEMPGDIDSAIFHFVKDLKMRLPLAMLFVTTLPKELEERVVRADFVESTSVKGVPCAHLAIRERNVDFQAWIPSSGDPLPQRIVITYRDDEGQPQYWANFTDWNLSPNPPAALFALDIPKDANRIEFLSQIKKAEQPAAKSKGAKK